jgi:hypothetical protein
LWHVYMASADVSCFHDTKWKSASEAPEKEENMV